MLALVTLISAGYAATLCPTQEHNEITNKKVTTLVGQQGIEVYDTCKVTDRGFFFRYCGGAERPVIIAHREDPTVFGEKNTELITVDIF